MTNTTKTEAAQVAQMVRAALKEAFPAVKFGVRSANYSGGNSVYVRWVEGPAFDLVDAIGQQFTAGKFDGMTDSYRYDHDKKGPTVMFVSCTRARVEADLRGMFASEPSEGFGTLAYRILRGADLSNGYAGLKSVDGFPGFEVIPATAEKAAA